MTNYLLWHEGFPKHGTFNAETRMISGKNVMVEHLTVMVHLFAVSGIKKYHCLIFIHAKEKTPVC
jgi:hypothetical protein